MSSLRPASCLLSGLLLCVAGSGCTSLDSFIGSGISNTTPAKHFVPIARAFERQGRLEEATAMYRKALHSDPDNITALARLNHIEALTQPRMFEGGRQYDESTDIQIARHSVPRAEQKIESVANLLIDVPTRTSEPFAAAEAAVRVATEPVEAAIDTTAFVSLFDTFDMEQTSSQVPDNVDTIVQIRLSEVTPASGSLEAWEKDSTDRIPLNVTGSARIEECRSFGDVQRWFDSPEAHVDQLLEALESGADSDTQALAAAALATVRNNEKVTSALRQACHSGNTILAATACDAVLERDGAGGSVVTRLQDLSYDDMPDTRSMVMAGLRHLAGTEWSSQAVETLAGGLYDADETVRSMAALTMGDFADERGFIVSQLTERRRVEANADVIRSIEQATVRLDGTFRNADLTPAFGVPLPFAE